MSRYLEELDEEIIIQVLSAYLNDSLSHRYIQKNILGLPAKANGGGFVTMEILHHYGIKGEHKGLLNKTINFEDYAEPIKLAISKVNSFNKLVLLADKAIKSNNQKDFDAIKSTEINQITKQRIGQSVLRNVVLENYSSTCAFCDIHQKDLLVCSHIVPWSIDQENRLNPKNAILLCHHHDGLFDRGYFGLDSEYNVVISEKSDPVITKLLKGLEFKTPNTSHPDFEFLERHLAEVCEL
jgi:putative restriction endonuclease